MDDVFDTSVQSSAVAMNTLTMGALVSSYDATNVWIDDVSVSTPSVPEPGSLLRPWRRSLRHDRDVSPQIGVIGLHANI